MIVDAGSLFFFAVGADVSFLLVDHDEHLPFAPDFGEASELGVVGDTRGCVVSVFLLFYFLKYCFMGSLLLHYELQAFQMPFSLLIIAF